MTTLVFQSKLKKEERSLKLSDLREAQHFYSTADAAGSLYYVMEEAIRLLTLRYSGSAESLEECGYAIVEKSSEGGGIIASTTPEEQKEFLEATFSWAESLSPKELRKSLCSMGNFRQGLRLARIVKGDDTIEVL